MRNKPKLLILSALAVMALASCGNGNSSSSSSSGTSIASSSSSASSSAGSSASSQASSSEQSQPSSSEQSQPSSSEQSQASSDQSQPSSSEQSSDHSSEDSSQHASSSSEDSSSSEQSSEPADWIGQAFVGQYMGGFTTLIINEDKTTSWDTDDTHFPAHFEALPGGVFHIYSDESVADEDKVDIYTDGTMACVTHDAIEKDAFIVDKNAEYQAAGAMAAKADGSLVVGSIEVGGGFKFFSMIADVFSFDIELDLNYGSSIEDAGAIFALDVDGVSSTYRVVTAGSFAAGLPAIIEDYSIVKYVYHGEKGDLVIAMNEELLVFVTLDGYDVDPELVNIDEDGSVIIKDGERTLDDSDPSHLVWVYSADKFVLNDLDSSYEVVDATSTQDVFHALDTNDTTYTAVVGGDGCLWATFTPSVGGFFDVSILSGTGVNDPYDYSASYDYIAIYRYDAASYGYPYTYAEQYAYWDGYYGYDAAITNFQVEAGMTYIIKAMNSDDRSNVIGDTTSACAGMSITIGYAYRAFDVATYTGDQGTLLIESYNGSFKGVSLNGQALQGVTMSGNTITSTAKVVDFSDPSDPQMVTTVITITLNSDEMTFVYESNVNAASAFIVLTEADSGSQISTQVGPDGNLWAVFTPTSSGYLSVREVVSTSSDGYLALYEATAPSFTPNNYLKYSDVYSGLESITNYMLTAGVTYVIKAGAYADRSRVLGDTGSTFEGATETLSFEFSRILTETFTGDAGDLIISTEDGEFRAASIGGASIADCEFVNNGDGTYTISVLGAGTYDTTDPLDPIRESTDVVYTVDVEAGTYVAQSSTATRHMFTEIDSTPATVTGIVDVDGNLWAKFTAPADGYLTVNELQCAGTDGYLAVYPSTAASFGANATYSNNPDAIAYSDKGSNVLESVTNVRVQAGVTYVIKAGAYADRNNLIGGSATSSYKGKTESFEVIFDAFETLTFTGDQGDLVIQYAGSAVVSATLGGSAITGGAFDENGDFFIAGTPTYDTSDRLDPKMTSTDVVYHLDALALTYVVETVVQTKSIFHDANDSAVITNTVGKDGNLWIKFTAPADGLLSVHELQCTGTDGYLAVYPSTAASFGVNAGYSSNPDALSYSDKGSSQLEAIDDLEVQEGQVYIIKAGAYADRQYLVGGSATSANMGKTESVELIFQAFVSSVYTIAEGEGADLTVNMKGDQLRSALLGEDALTGAKLVDGNIVIDNGMNQDTEGNYFSSQTVYTLNDLEHTYTVEDVIIPFVPSENLVVNALAGSYGFNYDESTDSYTSSNAGINSSDAVMTVTMGEAGLFCFNFDVSSEGTSSIWDYLEIKVNGVVLTGYAKVGGVNGQVGKVALELEEGDIVTFTYHKDSSSFGGRDNAIISGMKLLVPSTGSESIIEEGGEF